jgi:hypothetical protein
VSGGLISQMGLASGGLLDSMPASKKLEMLATLTEINS